MPLVIHELLEEDVIEIKTGEGDISYSFATYNNYPTQDGYEKRLGLEIHPTTKKFPIGPFEGEVKKEDFYSVNPSVVISFPANNPGSLNSLINTLIKIRNSYGLWAVIFQKYYGKELESHFTIFTSKQDAEKQMAELLEIDNTDPLTVVEVEATMEDVAEENWGGRYYLKKNAKHK